MQNRVWWNREHSPIVESSDSEHELSPASEVGLTNWMKTFLLTGVLTELDKEVRWFERRFRALVDRCGGSETDLHRIATDSP